MNPKRMERLPWREIDGRTVVINPGKGQVHELDETATWLWKAADGSRSLDEILDALQESFDVGAADAKTDAVAFFDALRTKGLLEP